MAKRKKLQAPSAEDLSALDAEFRSETRPRPNPATAPISQIAADAAQASRVEDAQTRLDRLDAERLRRAEEDGLLITEIPTAAIRTDQMIRDRTVIEEGAQTELQISIRASGLRLPIEVYSDGEGYALISGYRRLLAVKTLVEMNPGGFTTIKALVRPARDSAATFAAMIEENEIRANLSPFERGRAAVLAAQQGLYGSTDEAVNHLFSAASKAKRSKVRSFAEIFETLGDMLSFPEALTERKGLRLASALRQGGEQDFREALDGARRSTPQEEWEALEGVIADVEAGPDAVRKRNRPKEKVRSYRASEDIVHLSSGVTIQKQTDDGEFVIRLSGRGVNQDLFDAAFNELRRLFETS